MQGAHSNRYEDRKSLNEVAIHHTHHACSHELQHYR